MGNYISLKKDITSQFYCGQNHDTLLCCGGYKYLVSQNLRMELVTELAR